MQDNADIELILARHQDALHARFGDSRVVVTGGAGSIGSRLVPRLIPLAKSVVVVDHDENGMADLYRLHDGRFDPVICDWREWRPLAGDTVFHLAARKHVFLGSMDTRRVADANHGRLERLNVEGVRLILASTDKAATPVTAYAQSKREAEDWAARSGHVALRMVNVWRSRGSLPEWAIRTVQAGGVIRYPEHFARWVMTAEDAVSCLLLAALQPSGIYTVMESHVRLMTCRLMCETALQEVGLDTTRTQPGPPLSKGENPVEVLVGKGERLAATAIPALGRVLHC